MCGFGSLCVGLLPLAGLCQTDTRPGIAPDIREDETPLKYRQGDFVAVPIPLVDPLLGEGLVAGLAYFHPQSEAEAATQPASVTGVAGLYTSNGSRAAALVQQNYWRDNRWRFTGVAGSADVRLSLRAPNEGGGDPADIDWRVRGEVLFARLSRKLGGNWYGGGLMRAIDASQSLELGQPAISEFDASDAIRTAGVGLALEYDSRDMPTNPYRGSYLKAEVLANDEALGSSRNFQTARLSFSQYRPLTDNVVLAWQAETCGVSGLVPLWDACRINLRGFPAFDYLGKTSVSGQVETRVRVSDRFGVALFAGSGWAGDSFSTDGGSETVPSAGIGLRYEVLPAKRINLRLDFAVSDDDEAIYLSVGEAF